MSAATTTEDVPAYPFVTVRLTKNTTTSRLIERVAAALRIQVGDGAADEFWTAAEGCLGEPDLARLVAATVDVR